MICYSSFWHPRYKYQEEHKKKFVLLTVEGSPDALSPQDEILPCNFYDDPKECVQKSYAGSGYTSWNVLGWGEPTDPAGKSNSSERLLPTCFPGTLHPQNNYNCFHSQVVKDPKACHLTRWLGTSSV